MSTNIHKKKRLVVIAGIFYPIPSPPGRCAMQYLDLLKSDFDITVVFIQSGLVKLNGQVVNNYKLYSLFNWRVYLINFFSSKSEMVKLMPLKKFYMFLILFLRAFGRLQAFFLWPDNLRWFYSKAYRKLKILDKEISIDYLLTINSPFTAHLAGRKFKQHNRDVKWITFTYDPYILTSEIKRSFIFKSLKKNWDFNAEKSVFSEADYNYVVEAIYENCGVLYEGSISKISKLPFLIEKIDDENFDYFNNSKFNIVYAGRFYRDIRNPEFMLKTFIALNNENILLHLFATSDCDDLITKYVNLSKGKIIVHKPVSVKSIQQIMMSSDCLVNVGNSIIEFKPSKIGEYISTGKPIINFYQNNLIDDTLKLYPIAIQIDVNNTNINNAAKEIKSFININRANRITWEEIEEIYPQYSAKFAKELMLKGFK
jgi:hypothetical protein